MSLTRFRRCPNCHDTVPARNYCDKCGDTLAYELPDIIRILVELLLGAVE